MVKALSHDNRATLEASVKEAERQTAAKISVIVMPASYRYDEFVFLYGIILSSVVSLTLWISKALTDFPLLLAIQLGIILLLDVTPWLRRLCIRLVPRRLRHRHAEQAARHEYHALQAHMPAGTPFILLFVSLAERYVHVLTNPVVHKEIPDGWHAVTGRFIAMIGQKGLQAACRQALQHAGEILAVHFPAK